ncbi:anthranilate synthase component II [Cyclobacterium marinum]|uniref:Glutamine amidotransferase of anthranilate synthase n=1 Tax=Cyclobacterium marinum (strain ATCC 25205 / DSM 745 / LMG 13164 / NCIMB 1802) TaxID=880070 RepID=G0IX53_CYCMS|nr:aminodeoxychorismate/anthranilate synthase component II [Cyclobacterium marinum]AEL25601.1 glutamine amidotransferase of anthranilate synthase [Cyclobacterium marinum DSM 745]MBI0401033.1 aminodeoxychorismate/anthranilate synthase component II [Cyclobacterium marinum]
MILLIDNFDSFAHILADYFRRTGEEVTVLRNNVSLEEVHGFSFSALVISPGPETPDKAGNLMEILAHYYDKVPILGICLGHQALGTFFGAKLVKSPWPMHGKISAVFQKKQHDVLKNIPMRFKVTRYHSLQLEEIPDSLEVILEEDNGAVMAFSHKYLPILGVQFHPEAHLTEYGDQLIINWVNLINELKAPQIHY